MILLRGLAIIVGLSAIAAVTHGTILATGGYGFDTNAPLYIALAMVQGVLAMTIGDCFAKRRRALASLAILVLVACEVCTFIATANLQLGSIETHAAPIRDAEAKHKAALARLAAAEHSTAVEEAEAALARTRSEAMTTSEGKSCNTVCKTTLEASIRSATAAVDDARAAVQLEKAQARAALKDAPLPGSATPLADRLGVQASTLDLLFVGFRGFAVAAGAAIALAYGVHGRRASEPTPAPARIERTEPRTIAGVTLVEDTRPRANDTDVARFMLACLPRARGSEAEMSTVYARFCRWCEGQHLRPHDKPEFALAIKGWCERGKISVRRDGGRVYCVDVKLAS